VRPSCVVNSIHRTSGSSIALPRRQCALQAVAGLGPRRPRRSYENVRLQAVAGLGPRRTECTGMKRMFRGDTLATTRAGSRRKSDPREVGTVDHAGHWIWWLVARRRSVGLTRTANAAVHERAPRCDDEGHDVGERHLPGERARPLGREEHVALVDRQQDAAHDERDLEGPSEHRSMSQRAAPARDERAVARLKDECRAGARGPACIAAGTGGRRRGHGPILAPLLDDDPSVRASARKCDIRDRMKGDVA
jgi:hypothetical protein